LVDIVNQTDLVENIDGEDKLGQPILRYQRFGDWGTLEAYVLPYFRRRTFEGEDGRLNGGFVVAEDDPIYASGAGSSHLDFALRYAQTFGNVDLGFSWFSGTSREPNLFAALIPDATTVRPFYPQIDQVGADIQLTQGSWLVKLEAIRRSINQPNIPLPVRDQPDYTAATVGVEYTLVSLFGSSYDLGLLSEYSWDQRDEKAFSVFQNDLFLGHVWPSMT